MFIIRKDIIETSQVVLNFCRTVLRMHKKTRKIQFYQITDKAGNIKRIQRNEENVCVCVCVCVCLDAGWCLVSTLND